MQKILSRIISIAVAVLMCASAAPVLAAPAPAAQNFITNFTLSNPTPIESEKTSLTVQLQKWAQIKKVQITVDGKVIVSCKPGKSTCVATMGPFVSSDAGSHDFVVVITPKKGIVATSSVGFTVVASSDKDSVIQIDSTIVNGTDPWIIGWKAKNKYVPAKNNNVPELERVSARTFELQVGKKLPLTAWAKNKSELLSLGVYIDNEEVPTSGFGGNCVMCDKGTYPANSGRLVGPFSTSEVGMHTYTILLIGKNGQRREYSGTFNVNL